MFEFVSNLDIVILGRFAFALFKAMDRRVVWLFTPFIYEVQKIRDILKLIFHQANKMELV